RLRADIEAVLLAAEEPVPVALLATVVECDVAAATAACAALAQEYRSAGRGFELAHVAGGVRLQTTAETADAVGRFVAGSNSARLSAAAMETLAVVAYKQPVSRAQITAVRGVNADAVVRSLCERGYLAEVGRDPGPGNAALLGTTGLFLEQLGIDTLDDLPSLAELQLDPEMIDRLDGAAGTAEDAAAADAVVSG
ncbi:MAG TPA: SMC-Scp complex subunit ScpB, partial [Acidimicrobiaceae bacterium]|nr:SMC-Scp complex subunit ScpB [Acidimicrobiaceae bacterium]